MSLFVINSLTYLDEFKNVVQIIPDVLFHNGNDQTKLLEQKLKIYTVQVKGVPWKTALLLCGFHTRARSVTNNTIDKSQLIGTFCQNLTF